MDKSVILNYIKEHPGASSTQITDAMDGSVSLATVKRMLAELADSFYVQVVGKGRATRYFVSTLFMPIDIDE